MLKTLFSNHGILGLNARTLLYIKPFNKKKSIAFADDKLKTKAFLTARGIPAAKIFARVETREQLHAFDFAQLPDVCVLKPKYGFGGEGILILKGRNSRGHFLCNGKEPISNRELNAHMEDILDGKFSLGGRKDTAFFEQILVPHECFAQFRPVGLPDIRVIVFNLVPVMAMLRIPTAVSEGKANLHLGGIGIGIDIAKGTTTHAAQYHHMLQELPHGGSPSGIAIPYWDDILLICSQIQQMTNIGYLAVDITIDQNMGPAILEVNARAGLNVQIANLAPLKKRLDRVQGISVGSPEKGVRIGKDLFSEHAKSDVQQAQTGKPVLGLHEVIQIAGDGASFEEPCLIAPEQERTEFSPELIAELEGQGVLESKDEQAGTYRVKFTLAGQKLQTLVGTAEDTEGPDRVVIGRRDLSDFLIDPAKRTRKKRASSTVKDDLRAVDKTLATLDKELLILKYVKPINLAEERSRLEEDRRYNPVFNYPELPFDSSEMRKRLENEIQDSSALGVLLEKKRKELLCRLDLLESRCNTPAFTQASLALFGKPNGTLARSARAMIAKRTACELPPPAEQLLTAAEAQEKFEAVLQSYSLHDWKVSVREKLVADCTVGGHSVYLREGALFAPDRVEALIKHEIETHVLTAENGDHQPYLLFRRGCAGYLDTQEGLATYNQNMIYGPAHEHRYNAPRNTLGLLFALEHSFAETRQYMEEELGYDPSAAIHRTTSMKRGLCNTEEPGAFTKSVVYFRGQKAIEKFVKNGGDLSRLYIGKIALQDLELVDQIPDLQQPLLLPGFLRQ